MRKLKKLFQELNRDLAVERILDLALQKLIADVDFSQIFGSPSLAFGIIEDEFPSHHEFLHALDTVHRNLEKNQLIAVLRKNKTESKANVLDVYPSEALQKIILFGRQPDEFGRESQLDIEVLISTYIKYYCI